MTDTEVTPRRKAVMKETSTRKIYDVHSGFYDMTFGRLVRKRIERAISHMRIQPGETVLDLGIGTGTSLKYYPAHANVVGIDLSAGMLREAQKKIDAYELTNVTLMQADALHLPFADNAFDHIFISHVISVVSDPVTVMREAQRVAKHGSRIVLLNHFLSSNPVIAKLEKWVNPICTKIGWRSDLPLGPLIDSPGVEVDYRYRISSPDLWETVVLRNIKAAMA